MRPTDHVPHLIVYVHGKTDRRSRWLIIDRHGAVVKECPSPSHAEKWVRVHG